MTSCVWFSTWRLASVTFHISILKDICDILWLVLSLPSSLVAMSYKYVFVFAIIQCIVLENVCNGQFHWAKHENRNARMKELLRELLRDDGSSYKVCILYCIYKWALLFLLVRIIDTWKMSSEWYFSPRCTDVEFRQFLIDYVHYQNGRFLMQFLMIKLIQCLK